MASLQAQFNSAKNAMLLATLDWVQAPYSIIQEELRKADGEPYTSCTIDQMRGTDAYREMIAKLEETWKKGIALKASSREVRNTASQILYSCLKRMMELVARPKTAPRDIIAIARLTAQMTGNIIIEGEDGDRPPGEKQESIASELITALGRMKDGTIQ